MTMTAYTRAALGLSQGDSDEELDIDLLHNSVINGNEEGKQPLTGTRALMLAVLEDAVRCYLDGRGRIAEEAELWIKTNWRGSPFSFAVVCETLRLNAQAVRARLEKLKATKVNSRVLLPRARRNVRAAGRVCSGKFRFQRRSRKTS